MAWRSTARIHCEVLLRADHRLDRRAGSGTSDYLEATRDGELRAGAGFAVPVYFSTPSSTTTAQITSGSVAMQLDRGGEHTFRDRLACALRTITR